MARRENTRRENTQHRRPPVRRSRPLVLAVCGAKCTEPQYFRSLRDGLRSRAVDIQRAKALDPGGGRFELNPSTSVWRLVERMME